LEIDEKLAKDAEAARKRSKARKSKVASVARKKDLDKKKSIVEGGGVVKDNALKTVVPESKDMVAPPESNANVQRLNEDLDRVRSDVLLLSEEIPGDHLRMIRNRVDGKKNTETARELGVGAEWVSKVLARSTSIQLRKLLVKQRILVEAPAEEHRVAMLWRIAKEKEESDPRVSIQSIAEINKMDGTYNDGGGRDITIVLNNAVMAPGALDR